jgi:hypothetical protein
MKIVVLSMWHNEARLAPFFLGHYSYADEIHLMIGRDTTDNTREICARYPNVEIEEFTFPGGLLNDTLKIEKFNSVAAGLDCDWIMALDADEFIFPPSREDPRAYLSQQYGNLLQVPMWQVYRHVTEEDLDPARPALEQRRHGNALKPHHTKPVVVKPEARIEWAVGHHGYKDSGSVIESRDVFWGAHWAMADADMAIARYIRGRRDRMSDDNIRNRHGVHTFALTEEKIRQECAAHVCDPQLF